MKNRKQNEKKKRKKNTNKKKDLKSHQTSAIIKLNQTLDLRS